MEPRERPRGRSNPSLGPSSWMGSTETTGSSRTCRRNMVQNGSKRMVTSDLLVWQPAGPNSFSGIACKHGSGQAVLHSFFLWGERERARICPRAGKRGPAVGQGCGLGEGSQKEVGSEEKEKGQDFPDPPAKGQQTGKKRPGKRKEEKNMKEARARSPAAV